MNKALRFRRKLAWTWVAVAGVLFVAFYLAVRGAGEAIAQEVWVLPKVSGHEVLRAIKGDDRTRAIPVVVLTSSNHERDLVECYQLGVNSYIQKPVDLRKFQEVARHFGMYWLMVNHVPPLAAFSAK